MGGGGRREGSDSLPETVHLGGLQRRSPRAPECPRAEIVRGFRLDVRGRSLGIWALVRRWGYINYGIVLKGVSTVRELGWNTANGGSLVGVLSGRLNTEPGEVIS